MIKHTRKKNWHTWFASLIAISAVWVTNTSVMAQKVGATMAQANPTIIYPPDYPRQAAENNIEGSVTFKFNVDTNGRPYEIQVIDSEPKMLFDQVARNAFGRWVFSNHKGGDNLQYTVKFEIDVPTTINGMPVESASGQN